MPISAGQQKEIGSSLEEFMQVFRIIKADLDEAGELLKSGVSNYRMRTFMRTFFAFVEGTSFAIKRVAIKVHEHDPYFSPGQLCMLRERTYALDEGGLVKERTAFIDTATNLRFLVKTVAGVFGKPVAIQFDGKGWECFKKLIHLRNQITHPKNAESLKVIASDAIVVAPSSADLGGQSDNFVKGMAWYIDFMTTLVSAMEAGIREKYGIPVD